MNFQEGFDIKKMNKIFKLPKWLSLKGIHLKRDIAIDLGTANTLILEHDKIVLNEPSIIAVDRMSGQPLAVGTFAMQMHEKTHDHIRTITPLKDGVIADFHASELMLHGMVKMLSNRSRFLPSKFNTIVICIPSGITDVEKRAVKDSALYLGTKKVYMIYEPLAAAIGIGIDVTAPVGSMIVDIGGGTTEIAIIALSGISCNQSIKIAGNAFNRAILSYMRKHHNLLIGERTAEQIKIQVGAVWKDIEDPPVDHEVHGKDVMTGIPKIISIGYREVVNALEENATEIDNAIIKALELAPPELSADIFKNGIHITGGGALLRGLTQRLSKLTNLPIHIAEDPLQAVVRGTGIALKNIEAYKDILIT